MEKLFEDFDAVSLDQWVEKIHKDLKGKSPDVLKSHPEKELEIKADYHRDEAPDNRFSISKSSNQWMNRRWYSKNAKNSDILKDLNAGIDCIGVTFTDQECFNHLTEGVIFEHIDSDIHFSQLDAASSFDGHPRSRLDFDIIARGLKSGKWVHSKADFIRFYKKQTENQNIWISGDLYGNAGASTVQEIAYTANHLNEYIQLLTDEGISLEEINRKIVVSLSINEDYFVNIAKFKVFRKLTELIFSAYDQDFKVKPIILYGTTSQRFMAVNDKNNNLLRQTTQAMSAMLGGCDVITVQNPPTSEASVYHRMAKNIPLILKEESYLDKVIDVSEGSYFIDHLCDQIEIKSWNLFKEIENKGGLIEAVNSNFIQDSIEKNRNYLLDQISSEKKTFLGVNKYPSSLEEWKDVEPHEIEKPIDFKALGVFRIEEHYKTVANEQS